MNSLLFAALFVIGVATSQTCVDLINPKTGVSDCGFRSNLCNDPGYFTMMTTQCPKTCGRCPVAGACVDKINPQTGRSECTQTAHLCNDPGYFSFMTVQCPKTCGRCSG